MNNLLFTALIIALIYYFFYYLPQQKKLNANPPLQHHQATQTEINNSIEYEPGAIQCPSAQIVPAEIKDKIKKLENEVSAKQKDIQQKERTIIGLNNSYNKLETKSKKELDELKNQIKTITHQLTELQTHQNNDEKDLSKVLDELLKGIQDLNNEL